MARGGYRPGAGRPKKGMEGETKTAILRKASRYESPLAYMLSVMNDESADPTRRDRMAVAAAPFVHARAGEAGKKAEIAEHAKNAESGTSWAGLLQ